MSSGGTGTLPSPAAQPCSGCPVVLAPRQLLLLGPQGCASTDPLPAHRAGTPGSFGVPSPPASVAGECQCGESSATRAHGATVPPPPQLNCFSLERAEAAALSHCQYSCGWCQKKVGIDGEQPGCSGCPPDRHNGKIVAEEFQANNLENISDKWEHCSRVFLVCFCPGSTQSGAGAAAVLLAGPVAAWELFGSGVQESRAQHGQDNYQG